MQMLKNFIIAGLLSLSVHAHAITPTPQALQDLAPDLFADIKAIESIKPLTGGLTNEAFIVKWQDQPVVVRIGTNAVSELGIQRKRELFFHQVAAFLNLSPPILHADPNTGLMISRYIQGQTLNNKTVKDHETLKKIVAFIHQYQNIRKPLDNHYSRLENCHHLFNEFQSKVQAIQDKDIDQELQGRLANYQQLLKVADDTNARIATDDFLVMTHHDLFSSNIIDDGKRVWLIDWEYAQFADRFVDLCILVSEDHFTLSEMKALYQLYQQDTTKDEWPRFVFSAAVAHLQTSLWYEVQQFEKAPNMQQAYLKKAAKQRHRFHELLAYFNRLVSSTI